MASEQTERKKIMSEATNVKVTADDKRMVLEIDLTAEPAGKSGNLVASSHGWQDAGSGFRYSLNVVTSDKIRERASDKERLAATEAALAEALAKLAAADDAADEDRGVNPRSRSRSKAA